MKIIKIFFIFSIILLFSINLASAFNWSDGSLVSYYSLNEDIGTTVFDSKGNYDGVFLNTGTWDTGKIGNGLTLNGTQGVNLTHMVHSLTNFSFGGWINKEGTTGTTQIILLEQTPATFTGYEMWLNDSDYLFCRYGRPTMWIQMNSATPLSDNTWYNVYCVLDVGNTNFSMWINGNYHTSITTNGDMSDSTTETVMGSSTAATGGFNGTLDEMGIWNRSLLPDEISELYNDGDGLQFSNSGFLENLSYSNPVLEFSDDLFEIYLNRTELGLTDIDSDIEYNGVNYTMSKSNGSQIFRFYKTLNIPAVSLGSYKEEKLPKIWHTFFYSGGSNTTNVSYLSQNVYELNISIQNASCSGQFSQEVYKILDWRNETTDNGLLFSGNTPSIFTSIRYWNPDNESQYVDEDYILGSGNKSYYVCSVYSHPDFPSIIQTTNSLVSYSGFVDRRNHLCLIANSTSITDTFYMRNSSQDYNVFYFNVIDQYSNDVPNMIISFERYISGVGYAYVGGYKTDQFGNAVVRLVADENYNIQVINSSDCEDLKDLSLTLTCSSLPCEYTISLSADQNPYETLEVPAGFSYVFGFDSNAKYLTANYTYTGTELSRVDLNVYRRTIYNDTSVCTSTSYLDEDYLSCNVSSYNSGTFVAYMTITRTDGNSVTVSYTFDLFEGKEIFGTEGLIWALLIVLALFFAGIWNPAVAIGLSVIGLILVAILGLIALPWLFIVLISIVAIIIIIKLRS